jgi:hypothetical protein
MPGVHWCRRQRKTADRRSVAPSKWRPRRARSRAWREPRFAPLRRLRDESPGESPASISNRVPAFEDCAARSIVMVCGTWCTNIFARGEYCGGVNPWGFAHSVSAQVASRLKLKSEESWRHRLKNLCDNYTRSGGRGFRHVNAVQLGPLQPLKFRFCCCRTDAEACATGGPGPGLRRWRHEGQGVRPRFCHWRAWDTHGW